MRRLLRLMALMFFIAALASCGWMKARERTDYQDARAGKPLAIPEGLDAPRDSAALTIPDTTDGKNETDVSEAPPSVAIDREPIVPVTSELSPDATFAKIATALRGTSGLAVSDEQATRRSLKVTIAVAQARRSWWSRLTGRDRIDTKPSTRTVSVLGAGASGSAVTVQDARGNDDIAARRILTAIRQALR